MNYTTQRNAQGGFRFDVRDLPARGTKLVLTNGSVVTYQEQGPAGMLLCTDTAGAEQLLFPQRIAGLWDAGAKEG